MKLEGNERPNRVENGGADAAFLQKESTGKAGHASADDGDNWVIRDWSSEGDLLLLKGLQDGPS